MCQTVTAITHLSVYKICRKFDSVIPHDLYARLIPLVDLRVALDHIIEPVDNITFHNLLALLL